MEGESNLRHVAERNLESLVSRLGAVGHNNGSKSLGSSDHAVQSLGLSRVVCRFRQPGGVRSRDSLTSAIDNLPLE